MRDILIRWLGGVTRAKFEDMEKARDMWRESQSQYRSEYVNSERAYRALQKEVQRLDRRVNEQNAEIARVTRERDSARSGNSLYAKRLHDIAALETPNANGTVRKMARLARGEMESANVAA